MLIERMLVQASKMRCRPSCCPSPRWAEWQQRSKVATKASRSRSADRSMARGIRS